MYNLPFWSNYFGKRLDPNCDRGSNQTAEAFFNMAKNLQANREKHIRPVKFISCIQTIIEGGIRKTCESSIGITATSIEKKMLKIKSPTAKTPRSSRRETNNSPRCSTTPRSSTRKRIYEGDIEEKEELNIQEEWGTKEDHKKRMTYYNAKRMKQMANIFHNKMDEQDDE
uniref:Uncharacterized protein n=1 Tax=Megaselia scalaris TaxID=36166 RepID=T1H4G4_MEGSC